MVISNCNTNDDAAYSVAAGDEKCATELFVKGISNNFYVFCLTNKDIRRYAVCCDLFLLFPLTELPVKIVKGIEPVKTTVNERIELECEVSEEGAQVKW